jgi:hypothetical protein
MGGAFSTHGGEVIQKKNLKKRDHLAGQGVDERIILKRSLQEWH